MKKWRCFVCGELFEGDEPPVPCPVCGAGADMFEEEVAAPAEVAPVDVNTTRWRCIVCGEVFEGELPPTPCPICGAEAEQFEKLAPTAGVGVVQNPTDDKYVLVGGGVASLQAARAIRKRNATATITMVSDEGYAPYNRPALSDVLCEGQSCDTLLLEQQEFYEKNNIKLVCGTKVESVDPNAHTLRLSTGEDIRYTKLLLATGANPFNPIKSTPGAIPVMVLRGYDHAVKLAEAARGKRVVLVGGGILGLEAALSLREIGCDVTVVEFAPRLMPLQCDETASAALQKALENLGIAVLCAKSVQSATPTGVVFSDGAEMAADIVVASMGVRSEVGLAVSLGLELGRGIVVDKFMHTSHPDIWAAGDCAEYDGRIIALVGAASAMGAVAGASMAGDESEKYSPFTPATSFSFEGFTLFSVGNVGDSATETACYTNHPRAEGEAAAYRRLFFNEGLLQGAVYLGGGGIKAANAVASKTPLKKALELLL